MFCYCFPMKKNMYGSYSFLRGALFDNFLPYFIQMEWSCIPDVEIVYFIFTITCSWKLSAMVPNTNVFQKGVFFSSDAVMNGTVVPRCLVDKNESLYINLTLILFSTGHFVRNVWFKVHIEYFLNVIPFYIIYVSYFVTRMRLI